MDGYTRRQFEKRVTKAEFKVSELEAAIAAAHKTIKRQADENVRLFNAVTKVELDEARAELEKARQSAATLQVSWEKVRAALSDVLDIVDSPESKAEAALAWSHGMQCSGEVSERNGEIIEAAYRLLGKERP